MQSVIRRKRREKPVLNGDLKYENVLNRQFTATEPNQKWVTDITYMKTKDGVSYLSVVRDLCGNVVVGYEYGESQGYGLVRTTIQKAIDTEHPADVILHSDGGGQYRSYDYRKDTLEYNITPSMSRPGTPADNACAENFFSIFKTECLYLEKPENNAELFGLIDKFIPYYNNERITGSGLTPMEIRGRAMAVTTVISQLPANLDGRPAS